MSFATPQHFLVCIIDGKSSAIDPSNVRLWHKADMLNALTNVRFWGQSGHGATAAYQSRFMSTRPSSTLPPPVGASVGTEAKSQPNHWKLIGSGGEGGFEPTVQMAVPAQSLIPARFLPNGLFAVRTVPKVLEPQ